MDKNTVIVYTGAYNSESVIERTIKSVLNQTHTNWIWHIVDNGCTDKTGEIIREYAASDNRIIAHRNEKNHEWKIGNRIIDILDKYDDNLYLAAIDADDEFFPDCFEKVLAYGNEHNLDMICYAYVYVNGETGVSEQRYHTQKSLILNETDKAEKMLEQMALSGSTSWSTIVKIRIKKMAFSNPYGVLNLIGNDCINTAYRFCISKRIGVLPDALYKYYIYNWSVMGMIYKDHNKNFERYFNSLTIPLTYRKMLADFNLLTDKNNARIFEQYGNICISVFNIVSLTDYSDDEKLVKLRQLIDDENVSKMLNNPMVRYRVKHMFITQGLYALRKIPAWRNIPNGVYLMRELRKRRGMLKGYHIWKIARGAAHFLRTLKNSGHIRQKNNHDISTVR